MIGAGQLSLSLSLSRSRPASSILMIWQTVWLVVQPAGLAQSKPNNRHWRVGSRLIDCSFLLACLWLWSIVYWLVDCLIGVFVHWLRSQLLTAVCSIDLHHFVVLVVCLSGCSNGRLLQVFQLDNSKASHSGRPVSSSIAA